MLAMDISFAYIFVLNIFWKIRAECRLVSPSIYIF